MRYYSIISKLFTHGRGHRRGYGNCLKLPWELTSKHRGGIHNTPVPPSPREHCVSLSKKASRDFFFNMICRKGGKKQATSVNLLFSTDNWHVPNTHHVSLPVQALTWTLDPHEHSSIQQMRKPRLIILPEVTKVVSGPTGIWTWQAAPWASA